MELKAQPGRCEEASPLSGEKYIPCNAPAERMVTLREEGPYRMCAMCADHNVKNRGGQDVGAYEPGPEDEPSAPAAPDVSTFDYGEHSDVAQGDDTERHGWLDSLAKNALALPGLERDVAAAETKLKAAQDALKKVAEETIPDLMEKLDLTVYPLRDGGKIVIKEAIRASIPVSNQPAAFSWLRSHDHGAMIKRAVTLTFGMGEDDQAKETLDLLRSKGLSPENKESVHPSTLSSWAKETLEAGQEIPDLFTVFRQRTAQVKV